MYVVDEAVGHVEQDQDHFLLSATFHDESGADILVIRKNEIVQTVAIWDITFEGQVLTIRRGKGDVLFKLRFRVPNTFIIERGIFWFGRELIEAFPDRLVAPVNNQIRGCTFRTPIGIALSIDDRPLPSAAGVRLQISPKR